MSGTHKGVQAEVQVQVQRARNIEGCASQSVKSRVERQHGVEGSIVPLEVANTWSTTQLRGYTYTWCARTCRRTRKRNTPLYFPLEKRLAPEEE